jgi:hypothetical protein
VLYAVEKVSGLVASDAACREAVETVLQRLDEPGS